MKKAIRLLPLAASYFFILLFIYAAVSKVLDFENFQIQIAQSPILSSYAGIVSYLVIILELIATLLLIINRTNLMGFYITLAVMMGFTAYIYLILNYSEFIPCSCGGILEKMGWTEHFIFNAACVLLATCSIMILEKQQHRLFPTYSLRLALVLFGSSILVIALYNSSEFIMKKENNFTRRFLPHSIDFPEKINLSSNSFYFAGSAGDSIFLGNTTAPLVIGSISPAFKTFKIDTLSVSDKTLDFNAVRFQISYPYYSFTDGKVPVIFQGKFPDKTAYLRMKDSLFFSQIMMASPDHYVFRSHHRAKNENVVGSLNIQETYNVIKFNFHFLEKQLDGIFDTDGKLTRDNKNGEYVYTYFYRNEYRRIDKNLKFLGHGRTIDSTSKAQIEIATKKDGEKKMLRPPLKVNNIQAAYDGMLFNMSNLKGRHESEDIWKSAKIIDVYDYKKNTYLYSFPLYNMKDNKVRDIWATGQYLYALTGNDIIRYKRMYKPR